MSRQPFEPRMRKSPVQSAPDNSRLRVIDALDDAWRTGSTFTLHVSTEGQVVVMKNRKRMFSYDDVGECIAALFPDMRR